MQFSTAVIAVTTLALASAAPAPQTDAPVKTNDYFRIVAMRLGSNIQDAPVQALNRGLYLNQAQQNASCNEAVNYATFRLNDAGELLLRTDNPAQTMFTDRSGMGQGILQYTTGVQGIPRYAERGPFAIANNELVFAPGNIAPVSFQACPIKGGEGYRIWLQGATKPGGDEGCVGFVAKTQKIDQPLDCIYTQ